MRNISTLRNEDIIRSWRLAQPTPAPPAPAVSLDLLPELLFL